MNREKRRRGEEGEKKRGAKGEEGGEMFLVQITKIEKFISI